MQNNKLLKLGMVAFLTVTLAACSSTDTTEPADTSVDTSNTSDNTSTASSQGTGVDPNAGLSNQEIQDRDEALAMTVFYFEFDRSDLSAEARDALVHHSNRLKDNPGMNIRLEGHADERGTREYNIALGERRAQAIGNYLQVLGVASSQLELISYGEESPVSAGSTQAAYARNRRVEIH